LEEFDMIIDYAEFDDHTAGRAHRKVGFVRKAVSELDRRAARAEELVKDLGDAEKRLLAVESEVADLRSRLQTANLEISRLRSTEKPVVEAPKRVLEAVSDRFLQRMENLERKMSEHVRRFSELQMDPAGRSCSATRNVDAGELVSEDTRNAETTSSNNGGVIMDSWSAVVGRRACEGPGSGGSFRSSRTLPASTGPRRRLESSMRVRLRVWQCS